MALHLTPTEHDANPPESWVVTKTGSRWLLTHAGDGATIGDFRTRREATEATHEGFLVALYAEEEIWFNGGQLPNCKPSPWPVRVKEAPGA
jgi:hypothetical protein